MIDWNLTKEPRGLNVGKSPNYIHYCQQFSLYIFEWYNKALGTDCTEIVILRKLKYDCSRLVYWKVNYYCSRFGQSIIHRLILAGMVKKYFSLIISTWQSGCCRLQQQSSQACYCRHHLKKPNHDQYGWITTQLEVQ